MKTRISVEHIKVGDMVVVRGYGKERPSGLAIEFHGRGELPVVGVKDYVNVEVPATEFCGHSRTVTVPKSSIVEAWHIDNPMENLLRESADAHHRRVVRQLIEKLEGMLK